MLCIKEKRGIVAACMALLLVGGQMQAQEPLRKEAPDSLTSASMPMREAPDSLAQAAIPETDAPDSLPLQPLQPANTPDSLTTSRAMEQEEADSTFLPSLAGNKALRADSLSDTLPLFPDESADTLRLDAGNASAQIVSGGDTLAIIDGTVMPAKTPADVWSPDPSRATWSAIAFPGGGQIYNRKYWKLPIVYGGFLGCVYALNWNNQMYSDYSQAYLDIMDDDDKTASYLDMLPPTYNVEANKEYLKTIFKNRKDRYRRYRDLSIFSFVGVYLISVIDAYVDAELSHFDISEDLGLRIQPSVCPDFTNPYHSHSYGLQCSINF